MPDPKEQASASDTLAMMNRSLEEKQSGVDVTAGAGEASSVSPISASQMRGDAVVFERGGLRLLLKPLKRKTIRLEFSPLVEKWPAALFYGALVQNPSCPGIDFDATAALMTFYADGSWSVACDEAKSAAKNGESPVLPPRPAPTTVFDVSDMLSGLVMGIESHLPTIADTAWLMCAGTPGIAWPRNEDGDAPHDCVWLDDALDDAFEIPDFADLLRAMLATNGGFKGDIAERFTAPS